MGVLLGLLVSIAPVQAVPELAQFGPVWQRGAVSIVATHCPPSVDSGGDPYCHSIEVRHDSNVKRLGTGGYIRVQLLWQRHGNEVGPDVLVYGDWGGSGGHGDLFAITTSPHLAVRQLSDEYMDAVRVSPGSGALRFELPYSISFNNASHAGTTTVGIPMRWTGDDFAVAMDALIGEAPSEHALDFWQLAVREDLNRWKGDEESPTTLYPSRLWGDEARTTARALTELALSGRADAARQLLRDTWPRQTSGQPMEGEDRYWRDFCAAILRNSFWKQFDLDRLPHADLIEAGAAEAAAHRSES